MIVKGTDKHMNKIPDSPSLNETKKMHFTELLISLAKYYQYDWKMPPKRSSK